MNKTTIALVSLLGGPLCTPAAAQDAPRAAQDAPAPKTVVSPSINLSLEARADYQREVLDGTTIDSNSGFKGKYLNVKLTGLLTPRLKYTILQRLNKSSYDSSVFDATDYAYLEYFAGRHWTLSGGKQFVNVGGFEYDRAPIDIYRGSEFWNNIQCHQWGISATYKIGEEGRDRLQVQLCTNPFNTWEGSNANTYAYNFMWMGSHGLLSTIYSANMIEYRPGHYISYLALGHNFKLGRKVSFDLDYMNRAASGQTFFFRDASVMSNLSVDLTPQWQLFAKGTYDVNRHTEADYAVRPGTEITLAGVGAEFRPLKERRSELRFHAFCFYSWGKNGNPDGALQDRQLLADVGVTWYMHLLRAGR